MPQPLKSATVLIDENIILERPEMAAELGNICAHWSRIDSALVGLYSVLMGVYSPGRSNPSRLIGHPIASHVFDTLSALGPRLDLIVRLCKWHADKADAEYFERILRPKIRKAFAARSELVHGLWGTSKKHPNALILYPTIEKPVAYKLKDFQDVSDRLALLYRELYRFTFETAQRLNHRKPDSPQGFPLVSPVRSWPATEKDALPHRPSGSKGTPRRSPSRAK
jgi:hypothetical protein